MKWESPIRGPKNVTKRFLNVLKKNNFIVWDLPLGNVGKTPVQFVLYKQRTTDLKDTILRGHKEWILKPSFSFPPNIFPLQLLISFSLFIFVLLRKQMNLWNKIKDLPVGLFRSFDPDIFAKRAIWWGNTCDALYPLQVLHWCELRLGTKDFMDISATT